VEGRRPGLGEQRVGAGHQGGVTSTKHL